MKFELSEKSAQRLIDALEDEIIILQRKVLSLEEILSEINVLKQTICELVAVKHNMDLLVESIKTDLQSLRRELSEKDAEIEQLKGRVSFFIKALSAPKPTP
jgi:predicted RNase H-like nuclease (RuvC/YqgF family)